MSKPIKFVAESTISQIRRVDPFEFRSADTHLTVAVALDRLGIGNAAGLAIKRDRKFRIECIRVPES